MLGTYITPESAMIEMRVTAVTTHPQTGRAVAVLEPRDSSVDPTLALGITRAEACSLSHELQSQATMRSQAYALLARCLSVQEARPRAVCLLPAATGHVTARLDLEWPDGGSQTAIEVGHGLGLAVTLGVPLFVSEALFRSLGAVDDELPATTSDGRPDRPADPPAAPIPASFRRAFE